MAAGARSQFLRIKREQEEPEEDGTEAEGRAKGKLRGKKVEGQVED